MPGRAVRPYPRRQRNGLLGESRLRASIVEDHNTGNNRVASTRGRLEPLGILVHMSKRRVRRVPPRRGAGKDRRAADLEKRPLRVSELGWTRREAAEARGRLAAFEEDWNAPGMDACDDL